MMELNKFYIKIINTLKKSVLFFFFFLRKSLSAGAEY